jgi:CRP-like cAMP-binding protein
MRSLSIGRPSYAKLPFFDGWSDRELARFGRLAEVIDYKPGDVLAASGQRPQEFVLILCGKVDIIESRRQICTLGEGDTLGAEAMLTKSPPTVSAVAQTYVRALLLGPRQFNGMLREAPSMGRRLAQLLAERLATLPSPA